MNNRERVNAILHYKKYDRLPIVNFGYWRETLEKWAEEGHISKELAKKQGDGNEADYEIGNKLGFDFNWARMINEPNSSHSLKPRFEYKVLEVTEEGYKKVTNSEGVVVLVKDGIVSIPVEIDHILKDRASWEEHYLPRLQYAEHRTNHKAINEYSKIENRDFPVGLHCGSLYGQMRNYLGVEGISYLYLDDEELYIEIINTIGELCYKVTEGMLKTGFDFDYAHFWEDICFKNGPLVNPRIFEELVGPHYKRITDLVKSYGIDIISLDCDGWIDALIPTWFNNGINVMFPMEVGTWNASMAPWREKYGKELRGVGGMNKTVFAGEKSDIEAEVKRLKPLVELGGYIPCPDHRIAPDAKWENVQYYCELMRKTFG